MGRETPSYLGTGKNGEMGPEAHHGFQGVRSEAEDVFPKRRENLETDPQPLECKGGGRKGEREEQTGDRRWHRIDCSRLVQIHLTTRQCLVKKLKCLVRILGDQTIWSGALIRLAVYSYRILLIKTDNCKFFFLNYLFSSFLNY
jgi:hypothetical protein